MPVIGSIDAIDSAADRLAIRVEITRLRQLTFRARVARWLIDLAGVVSPVPLRAEMVDRLSAEDDVPQAVG